MTLPIDVEAVRNATVVADPFPYLMVPRFVKSEAIPAIEADFPQVTHAGSFPLPTLNFGPKFQEFMDAIRGPEFTRAVADKFGIDLSHRPTMVTVRGQSSARDGQIHTDSVTKLITVLIYMNESWEAEGGRLRLLRSPERLDDVIAEVPPAAGTLLAFQVTPHSWHGHAPVDGPRRVIQLNWVTDERVVRRERLRHGLSARMKRLFSRARS